MKTLFELYRDNAEQDGATVKTGDSIYWMLVRWISALGGFFFPGDTKNVLLQKLARAKGVIPKPGDTDIKILRRIASANSDDNEWWCLYKLLTSPSSVNLGPLTATVDAYVADLGFNTARADVTWTPSSGAAGYRVEASFSSDFSALIANVDVGNVLLGSFTFTYADTPPQVPVYVRVVAYNGGDSRDSNVETTHFNVFDLATPAPHISDSGGGVIGWIVEPGTPPSGYSIIEFESSVTPDSGFSSAASDNSSAGITDIGATSVYVRARFRNLAGDYTPFSSVIFAEP